LYSKLEKKNKNVKMATSKLRLNASLKPKMYVDHETGSKAQDDVTLGQGTCSIRQATQEQATKLCHIR